MTDAQVSEAVKLSGRGKSVDEIANLLINSKTGKPVGADTVRKRLNEYSDNLGIPMNIVDVAKELAVKEVSRALMPRSPALREQASSQKGDAQRIAA